MGQGDIPGPLLYCHHGPEANGDASICACNAGNRTTSRACRLLSVAVRDAYGRESTRAVA